jgi:flagellar protein FlbD
MIRLTKLNGSSFVLNCELIEMLESTPDTVITMNNGKKFVVTESVEVVVDKVIQYKGNIFGLKNDIST